jgi:glycosyltransferase involved in cell wall biosynthesis
VHGFVRDLSPITENADLAVVPLHAGGGMRVKILDYWSLGIPVVSTRIGAEGLGGDASSEVLALGDTPEDFAAQITRLGRDDGARAAMRAKAFDLVSANYGWPALIDRILDRVEALREERRDR